MARKRKELPELHNIEVTGVAAEGKALARVRLRETDESVSYTHLTLPTI